MYPQTINITQEKTSSNSRKVFRCTDCYFIPLLSLNENEKSVTLNCPNGHLKKLLLSDYLVEGFKNSLDKVKCAKCKTEHKPKTVFKYCENCNLIFCENCLKKHKTSHNIISVRKMDNNCCIHKLKFSYHCQDCDKNICNKCVKNHSHHNLINFDKISLDENQINNFKNFVDKENEFLDEIAENFNKNIIKLQNKFNLLIKEQKDILKFKNNIIETYSLKNSNYECLQNLKNLNFDEKNFKLHLSNFGSETEEILKIFDFEIKKTNSELMMSKIKDCYTEEEEMSELSKKEENSNNKEFNVFSFTNNSPIKNIKTEMSLTSYEQSFKKIDNEEENMKKTKNKKKLNVLANNRNDYNDIQESHFIPEKRSKNSNLSTNNTDEINGIKNKIEKHNINMIYDLDGSFQNNAFKKNRRNKRIIDLKRNTITTNTEIENDINVLQPIDFINICKTETLSTDPNTNTYNNENKNKDQMSFGTLENEDYCNYATKSNFNIDVNDQSSNSNLKSKSMQRRKKCKKTKKYLGNCIPLDSSTKKSNSINKKLTNIINISEDSSNEKTKNYKNDYIIFNQRKIKLKKSNTNSIENANISRNENERIKNSQEKYKNLKECSKNFDKICSLTIDNNVLCLVGINNNIICCGDSKGKILIYDLKTFNKLQTIIEHKNSINNICLLHDESILTSSSDYSMKKINLINDYLSYNIQFIFNNNENSIIKSIELSNFEIISFSNNYKYFFLEPTNENYYINTLIIKTKKNILDMLETSKNEVTILKNCELNLLKNKRIVCSINNINSSEESNSSICKLNNNTICVNFYNELQFIDLEKFKLMKKFKIGEGKISKTIKLKEDSLLISDEINNNNYNELYLKKYIFKENDLNFISFIVDKYLNQKYKKNIGALIQLSNGIIVEGINTNYYNENKRNYGELIFYCKN